MPALPSHSSRERPIKIGILIWPHYNQFETILMNLKGAKKRKNGKKKNLEQVQTQNIFVRAIFKKNDNGFLSKRSAN